MVAFATALGAASEAQLPGVLEEYLDPLHLMRVVAVDRAISHWDGMMAWYCSQQWGACGNHNLYWYQQEGVARFQLIPWDLDNTFALQTPLDHVPPWTQDPPDCTWLPNGFAEVVSPSCDPLIRGWRSRIAICIWTRWLSC